MHILFIFKESFQIKWNKPDLKERDVCIALQFNCKKTTQIYKFLSCLYDDIALADFVHMSTSRISEATQPKQVGIPCTFLLEALWKKTQPENGWNLCSNISIMDEFPWLFWKFSFSVALCLAGRLMNRCKLDAKSIIITTLFRNKRFLLDEMI